MGLKCQMQDRLKAQADHEGFTCRSKGFAFHTVKGFALYTVKIQVKVSKCQVK